MLKRIDRLILGALTLGVLALAAVSLRWRPELDSPLLLYMAWLWRHGYVPYRDFFDMNCPGAYALTALVASCGDSDLALRIADLLWLGGLAAATAALLRPLGRPAMWAAVVLWGLSYLRLGPEMSLQREYLLLLPLALGLLAARQWQWPSHWRGFLGGLGLGLVITVKPPLLLAAPALVMLAASGARPRRPIIPWGALLAGLLVFPAVAGICLVNSGAWPYFLDLVRGYWPLYTHLSGAHQVMEGAERGRYLLTAWLTFAALFTTWLPLPLFGSSVLGGLDRADPRRALQRGLWALAAGGALYPLAGGQFWKYHWLPLTYALSLLAATAFMRAPSDRPQPAWRPWALAACLLVWAVMWARPQWGPARPLDGRPDAIAAWLHAHARPGDRVQPLDWTNGGVVQAMGMARVFPATRFLYSFHFYHHVSTPYIQRLRREFIGALRQAPPRFIVQTTVDPPWPQGADTTRKFPELETLLREAYRTADVGNGYTIWERRE